RHACSLPTCRGADRRRAARTIPAAGRRGKAVRRRGALPSDRVACDNSSEGSHRMRESEADVRADELRRLLEEGRAGRVSPDEAQAALQGSPVAELGYASVDLHRQKRCGFPEVIFCSGKTPEWVEGIARKIAENGQDCLATRVSDEQAVRLAAAFPHA